ncbi:hypothetical protein F0267_17190 [Vibrio coralliilyticus]|uniref:Uncharacterized protein n=1 Tax=Vibrio coralliilyticus TaxID=190893 RepID=A0AAN0SB72_9VIBR|nr:hypothetical protein [Vibrio coralliilyticus]AIW18675.1 hypothetical protein IX92_06275 [Vibrio coralliilyticus]NOH39956.1 hypothetical protein [Vibrio coralliilyticus]
MIKFLRVLVPLLISTFAQASPVSIDGHFGDWSRLNDIEGAYMTQAINDRDYLYIAFSQPDRSQFIPILNGDITFFVPNNNFVSYVNFGVNIKTGGSNSYDSSSDIKIKLHNGIPKLEYLSEINGSYINDVRYMSVQNNGRVLTEIAIPKKLFGKSTTFQDVTIVNQYKGPLFNDVNTTGSSISRMSRSASNRSFDFSDVTITVGISLSGFGANGSAGLAADDYGLGGYFSETGGDTDFGISLDIGIFNGDVTDLNGTTIGGSIPSAIGFKYEHPVSGSTLGSGVTLSFSLKHGYTKIPGMQLTNSQAGYLITDDDVIEMFSSNSGNSNSNGNNSDNDWSSDDDRWGHDDDHGPSYGGNDGQDWSHDDDDNSGYF